MSALSAQMSLWLVSVMGEVGATEGACRLAYHLV